MSAQPDYEEPVAAWSSPQGERPKRTEDVWIVEVTLTISRPGPTDRRGRPQAGQRTEEQIVAEVKRQLGLARDSWPKGFRRVEVDAVYRDDDDIRQS